MNERSPWGRLTDRLEHNAEGYGPLRGSLSMWRIGLIWLAANLVVTTLLTGTLFVPAVSWPLALILIVTGSVLGASVLVLIGNIGTRSGLPTMSLTKGAFGVRGSIAPAIANVVILMGWSWVQAMLAGVTVNFLVEQWIGYSSPALLSVFCQLLVVALAVFGHEGIAKVEPWFALVILTMMAYIFAVVFTAHPVVAFVKLPAGENLLRNGVSVLDVVIATAISWTVLSCEFNRLARSQRAGVVGSAVGYVLSTVVTMSLGATAIAYIVLEGSKVVAFDPTVIVGAFGTPIAIAIFLSVMATNTMVVYGMVASVVNMTPSRHFKFLPTALALGAVSVVGSTWLGLLEEFTAFLTVIGALFIPVFAIMIVDYYIVHKGSYDHDILRAAGGKFWYASGVNIAAMVVWVIAAGCSLMLTFVWQSPLGATVPTFVVAFGLYLAWALASSRVVSGKPVSTHLCSPPGSTTCVE